MKTYTINGIVAHAEEIKDDSGAIESYHVIVNGEHIGNRIDRHEADGQVVFESIARNEQPIELRVLLHDAVADVLNDGMRDKTRR